MKKIENRIEEIYKGELKILYHEYDYRKVLVEELPGNNELNQIVFKSLFTRLLLKINKILGRDIIFCSSSIYVLDSDALDGLDDTDDIGVIIKDMKNDPQEIFTINPEYTNNYKIHRDEFERYLTKEIDAPLSIVQAVDKRLRHELETYKNVLLSYSGGLTSPAKQPLSFNFNGNYRAKGFIEKLLNFEYEDDSSVVKKPLFIFNKSSKIAQVQKEHLIDLFRSPDIDLWKETHRREYISLGISLGEFAYLFNYLMAEKILASWRQPFLKANVFCAYNATTPTTENSLNKAISQFEKSIETPNTKNNQVDKNKYSIKHMKYAIKQLIDNHNQGQ